MFAASDADADADADVGVTGGVGVVAGVGAVVGWAVDFVVCVPKSPPSLGRVAVAEIVAGPA